MNPSKYKSISMRKNAWELATSLSKSLVPNLELSRSQVVEIALERMSKDIGNIEFDVTINRAKIKEIRKKAPDPQYVGTVSTKAEAILRNKNIFYHRCVAKDKLTLQQLGTCYNLSRERVRQIQEQMEIEVSSQTLKPTTEVKHASNN